MSSTAVDKENQNSQLGTPNVGATHKPKGILKNAPPLPHTNSANHLTWDEENLAATEIGKDSLMKITEPKTPYVRYDALTDTVEGMGDIPPFTLEPTSTIQTPDSNSPLPSSLTGDLAAQTHANTTANAAIADPSLPRRASSSTPRSNSRGSSRSTSFSLPSDDPSKAKLRAERKGDEGGDDGEIEEDEEVDPEAAAKHAAFVRARGRHYSNEAEAMKRAAQLLAEEEDDEDSSAQEKDAGDDSMEHDSAAESATSYTSTELPNGTNRS